jgi:hypothetical protein
MKGFNMKKQLKRLWKKLKDWYEKYQEEDIKKMI